MSRRYTQLAPPGSVDVGMRVALAAAVFVGFGIFVPGFATTSNMYAVLETTVPVGLVAVGVGAVILAGELDLSVGAVATCAGILIIRFVDIGVFPAVLLTVLAGAVYGIVQGVIIAKVAVPSVVFTLGSLIAVGGVAFILSDEQVVTLPLDQLGIASDIRTRIWIFSPASLTLLAVTVLVGLLLGYTRIGRGLRPGRRPRGVPGGGGRPGPSDRARVRTRRRSRRSPGRSRRCVREAPARVPTRRCCSVLSPVFSSAASACTGDVDGYSACSSAC